MITNKSLLIFMISVLSVSAFGLEPNNQDLCLALKTSSKGYTIDTVYEVSCLDGAYDRIRTQHAAFFIPLPWNWFGKSYEKLVDDMKESNLESFGKINGLIYGGIDRELVLFGEQEHKDREYCLETDRMMEPGGFEREENLYSVTLNCSNGNKLLFNSVNGRKDLNERLAQRGYQSIILGFNSKSEASRVVPNNKKELSIYIK